MDFSRTLLTKQSRTYIGTAQHNISPHYKPTIIIYPMLKVEPSQGRKVILFIGYTIAIYSCLISASVFEEKIYKVAYPSNLNPAQSDFFTDKLTPFAITAGVSCLLGFLIIKDEELNFDIPIAKLAKVSICDILTHVCLIAALIRTNYTTFIVVNTCSLISVILVGSFCTGVRYNTEETGEGENAQGQQRSNRREQIGPEKLWICGIVCLGIIIFSVFSTTSPQSTAADTATTVAGGALITIFLFATAITLEGFRPDFMQQIKHQYHPSSLFLYFSVNGVTFTLSLFISLITWNIKYFIDFALQHERLLVDLTAFSLLTALGGLFAYKLVNTFRQHIYPLVSNTRKCMTVCINVVWFGHHLAKMQWLGVFVVFTGIMMEIISNYNLAEKILPNHNVRSREGEHYNKIVPKEEEVAGYEGKFCEGVQGI